MRRLPSPAGRAEEILRQVGVADASGPDGLREMVKFLLLGKNYRLLSERDAARNLVARLAGVMDFVDGAEKEFGPVWPEELSRRIADDDLNADERATLTWLCGMAKKTAENLGVSESEELKRHFAETARVVSETLGETGKARVGRATMLMMGGAAMLFVRGSVKSKVGKRLEGAFLRSCFSLLGLDDSQYRVTVEADSAADREVDAEVYCFERLIQRFELGLIEKGNPEILSDKVSRVGRDGIVVFDRVSPKAGLWKIAETQGVHLVQIRNNRPLTQICHLMQRHKLKDGVVLTKPPEDEDAIVRAVDALPDHVFSAEKPKKRKQ